MQLPSKDNWCFKISGTTDIIYNWIKKIKRRKRKKETDNVAKNQNDFHKN